MALLLGGAQALAYEHTAWWPVVPAALLGLLGLLARARVAQAAWIGWAFGTGWLVVGVWWLFISMHRYGGLPAPLAALAVLALAAALSIYLGAAMAAYARWRCGRLTDVALFAGLWLLAELARGVLFTGFPWVASGYALVDSPLAAWAPWVGVYGMGALLAAAAAAAMRLLSSRGRHWGAAAGVLALIALPAVLPADFTRSVGVLKVKLLQTAVAQDQKFEPEHLGAQLVWLDQMLHPDEADLVVAPETAVPLLPAQLEDLAPGWWAALQARYATPDRVALLGLPLGDERQGYTNSVTALGRDYRYDKWHLVPFGEFIPTGFRWFTELLHIPLGDFARGLRVPPSLPLGPQRLAPNICFEDLFGEELARRFADAAAAPTILVNVSNLGWFGRSSAIAQHLHISRLRALELQRPMLRATNTGATAAIDHRGRVTAMEPPHTRGVLTATVEGREGRTPYAVWAGHVDLWPLLGLALVLVALSRVSAPPPSVLPSVPLPP